MTALLIAGTDTDVGKTFITIALATYWQKYRLNQNSNVQALLSILKLIQTGTGDVELYHSLFDDTQGIEIIAPLRFDAPVAPPIAAAKEGKIIALGEVWQEFSTANQKSDLVILESLGGLGSPVTAELIVGNIAADWRLPTVLVVPVKLGAIANAVANVALARSLNIDLRGIILNCSQPEAEGRMEDLTPINLIQSLTQAPVIGTLPYVENLENNNLALTAANWDLELILPKPKDYSRNRSIGI
ncbi:MAG: dethiobiotin synthase [Pleurocapsa sp.]